MKNHDIIPEYDRTNEPKQKNTTTLISLLIFYFFLAAVCGYFWEVLIFLVKDHQFCNRGFLYGPWLPVYGSGAILFYCLLKKLKHHPTTVFLLATLIGTGLELLIGWFLETVWGLRYWDYSDYILNFRGYICLWSALGFGIAGTLWICLLSAFIEKFWRRLPQGLCRGLNTVLFLLFLLDCTAAIILPNIGKGITF